jgi:hypothetical protein
MVIQRTTDKVVGVKITATLATCQAIPYGSASAGTVHVPAGSSLTLLTWYSSADGVTYQPLQDGSASATAITSTVSAAMACKIPVDCFGSAFLKAVGNTTGTVDLSIKA